MMNKPFEFLETPPELAWACNQTLVENFNKPNCVLDVGAGKGMYRYGVPKTAELHGIDNYFDPHVGYDKWFKQDFLTFETDQKYDWVIGNPPFSLWVDFANHAKTLLAQGGVIGMIGSSALLCTYNRAKKFWPISNLYRVYFVVPRPSFTGDGVTGDRLNIALYVLRDKPSVTYPGIEWLFWKDKYNDRK
jgi:hypothetical protein